MNLRRACMRRRLAVGGGTIAAVLAVAGCSGSSAAVTQPILSAPAGAPNLMSTQSGVIWAFRQGDSSDAVLRSGNHGQSWQVALPEQGPHDDLVASFFFGAGTAWALDQQGLAGGGMRTTVLGTADGGRRWWRSSALEGAGQRPGFRPHYELYFADAVHGWLLASGTRFGTASLSDQGRATRQRVLLWTTDNGGRTWSPVPARHLPLQGLALDPVGSDRGCMDQPTLAFANPLAGWLSEGSCGSGPARPVIWRTTDGGQHWTAVRLLAPPGGFGRWRDRGRPGTAGASVVVGPPRVVASGIRALVLVPVAVKKAGLVVEESADGGQTWQITSRLHVGMLPVPTTPAGWFDPIDATHWVMTAPGRLFETADHGQSWTIIKSAGSTPGAPAWFVSLGVGYLQGKGPTVTLATTDGGQTWVAQPAPPTAPATATASLASSPPS